MSIQETTAAAAASAARAYALPRSTTAAATEKSQESRKFEDIEDPIEISPQGRLASILASGTEGLIGVAPRADGSVHLEDMMARLSEISTDLQGVLGKQIPGCRHRYVEADRSRDRFARQCPGRQRPSRQGEDRTAFRRRPGVGQ